MYDLAGPDVPLTQEFLAQMMGVRRTSVSVVAAEFQAEGLISYHRGKLHILDVERLKRRACECHRSIQEQYVEIFGKTFKKNIAPGQGPDPSSVAQ
jgi:Mn-dependent DtxR family transcriptional regulator